MPTVRQKLEKMVTPRGVAVWPRITGQPDTKFDDAGVWKITLRLKKGQAATDAFVEALEQRHTAAVAQAQKENPKAGKKLKIADQPWKDDIDEQGNETGDVLVNFKSKASGVTKEGKAWSRKPLVVDAKGTELASTISVGGGSEVRVAFEIMPFYAPAVGAGISLRMTGVQVLSLVVGGKADAKSLGFEEEDGYEFVVDPTTESAEAADGKDEAGEFDL